MSTLQPIDSPFDFSRMHDGLQRWVDEDFLAGAASVVLRGTEAVDVFTCGQFDRERGLAMHEDVIFRIYSNTKPITAVAAMMLAEQGAFDLDDPIADHLPAFADLQVLKAGATSPDEVEPAPVAATIRQLFCHNAGLSYGIFAESPVDRLYLERKVLDPQSTLADLVDKVGELPLAYAPGARWQYSVASDVLARLIEVKSGQRFGEFLRAHVFEPLGMTDTDFQVSADRQHRFAANYAPVDPLDPTQPGLQLAPDTVLGSYTEPRPLQSGGGGLVSTISDYAAFLAMLMNDGEYNGARILKADTLAQMRRNQLPPGVALQLPAGWTMPDTVFGLGFAIKTAPAPGEPPAAAGEYHWGGLAGTHSWCAPRAGIAALVFTQRLPGFWHPFSHEFKRDVYAACT